MTTNPQPRKQQTETQTDHQKTEPTFKWLVPSLLFVALLLVGGYFLNFHSGIPSQERFGQFGDYFGGVLNPILGFATIGLLIWSIKAQREALIVSQKELAASNQQLAISNQELALTRVELRETKEEAALSRQAMQDQVVHLQKEAKLNELMRMMSDLRERFISLTSTKLIDNSDIYNVVRINYKISITTISSLKEETLHYLIYGNSSYSIHYHETAKIELLNLYKLDKSKGNHSALITLETLLNQFSSIAIIYAQWSNIPELTAAS